MKSRAMKFRPKMGMRILYFQLKTICKIANKRLIENES